MAARTAETVARLAVERARVRLPGLAPDSVQVVELVRGRAFVVVRTRPDGVLVLDAAGRLVRGRERLVAIARHVDATARVERALADAQLERRLEHATRSAEFLDTASREIAERGVKTAVVRVVGDLGTLAERLSVLRDEWQRQVPATERTLRRLVTLLDSAARSDRDVVRGARELALALCSRSPDGPGVAPVRRWVAARLASADIPFFYWELDAAESERYVADFVRVARA